MFIYRRVRNDPYDGDDLHNFNPTNFHSSEKTHMHLPNLTKVHLQPCARHDSIHPIHDSPKNTTLIFMEMNYSTPPPSTSPNQASYTSTQYCKSNIEHHSSQPQPLLALQTREPSSCRWEWVAPCRPKHEREGQKKSSTADYTKLKTLSHAPQTFLGKNGADVGKIKNLF